MKQYPSSWLKGVSLGEAIACELRLQIINGTVGPGHILSENGIAADFGTSRSPVRDAMKTLSNEGLIRLERMGAVVLGLGLKDVEELYDVRYLIESFVQRRLAGTQTDALISRLRQTIDKMELAAKHQDAVEFSYQDFSFHEAIITEAQHARMLHLWRSIREVVIAVMLITTKEVFTMGEAKISDVIDKHRRIIQGLESKDADRIEAGVRSYFADSHTTLHHSIPNS
ncbi:GntR family transcriptional regulator [Paenibacillus solisilvae]|uniref:GntR family transcriptional regulator n=1 Tax=Paenibacillus solisilvae TaxID=2486751 RepID=A0ABW0W6R1_9BACL